MSQLLLSTDEWIYHQFQLKEDSNKHTYPSLRDQRQFLKFDAKLMRHLLPHRQFTQVATLEDFKTKRYSVLFQNISKKHKGLLSWVYHKLSGKVSLFFELLDMDGKLLKLQTSQLLIEFARSIHLGQRHSQFPLKMMVNYESLQVFFQIIYFSHCKSNLVYDMESSSKYTNIVLQIYKNFIQKNLNVLEKGLEMLVSVELKLEEQEQKKIVQNLYRYANMMTMKSNFSIGPIISEQAKLKLLQQRQQSGRILTNRKQYVNPETVKHLQLYCMGKLKKEEKNKSQFYISGPEEKIIKKEIAFQLPQPEQGNTKQFMTFLNPIHVHQPEKLVTYPLDSGGFSEVFSSQVNFWLAESNSLNKLDLNPKNINRKILAVKKESRPTGKNLHQARILRELKAGYLPVLPRYYIPINMPNFPLQKNPLLMMDMLIYGNLADFMKNKKKFTSLNSKLVVMFSITMGLRFLEKFKIVHLDFKPSNIMMVPGLLIKIIDFGQAYHSEVVKKQGGNYKPGVTLPYSPPEVSAGQRDQFTSKSDVYSLGVVFYQLLFGRRPFQNREQCFLVPEENDKHGDVLLLRVLHWMISICLSRNVDARPELDWISMILKICMYMVI